MVVALTPYLFFTTCCEEALAFYADCGLGEPTILARYGNRGMPVRTEAFRGRVLHARFEGPGVLFHASDNDDAEPMRGSGLLLEFDGPEQCRALFAALGEGGRTTVPLARQAWGSDFGMLVDRFGIQWMFSVRAA